MSTAFGQIPASRNEWNGLVPSLVYIRRPAPSIRSFGPRSGGHRLVRPIRPSRRVDRRRGSREVPIFASRDTVHCSHLVEFFWVHLASSSASVITRFVTESNRWYPDAPQFAFSPLVPRGFATPASRRTTGVIRLSPAPTPISGARNREDRASRRRRFIRPASELTRYGRRVRVRCLRGVVRLRRGTRRTHSRGTRPRNGLIDRLSEYHWQ